MSESFRIKTLPAQRFAALRAVTTAAELPETLARCFEDVWGWLNRGFESVTVGSPITLYHAVTPDAMDIECGFPIAEDIAPADGFRVIDLPVGRAAAMLHYGPYSGLIQAWVKLEAEITRAGNRVCGPRWEIYWVDPSAAGDESEIRTELIWPLV